MTPSLSPASRIDAPRVGLLAGEGSARHVETPNWFQRFTGGLRDRLVPVPSELRGLFSPEDIKAMQRGALWSGRDPHIAFQEQANSVLQLRRAKEAEARAQQRAELLSRYGPRPGEAPAESAAKLQQLFAELVRMGDTEMAGKVGEVLKSQSDLLMPPAPKPTNLQEFDAGDRIILRDPVTGQERIIQKGATPRAAGEGGGDDRQRLAREDRLAAQYERAVKVPLEAYETITQSLQNDVARAKARDGAAQYSLLVTFIKALDPGSVAREGEVALARQAQSLWSSVQAGLARVQNGGLIDTRLVEQMEQLLKARQVAYARQIQRTRQQYDSRAKRGGSTFTDDLFYAPEAPVAPGGWQPHGGGAAPTGLPGAPSGLPGGSSASVRKYLR